MERQPKSSQYEYERFISSLDITSITFPKLYWELIESPQQGMDYAISPVLEIDDPQVFNKSNAIIKANLELEANEVDKKESFLRISINLKFEISFNPDFANKDVLKKYKYRNGIMSIMSIFREQVRNATFQLGLPQLILPTFKVYPEKESTNK